MLPREHEASASRSAKRVFRGELLVALFLVALGIGCMGGGGGGGSGASGASSSPVSAPTSSPPNSGYLPPARLVRLLQLLRRPLRHRPHLHLALRQRLSPPVFWLWATAWPTREFLRWRCR